MDAAPVTVQTLKDIGAVWQYAPGSPAHAELTSGLHGDLYINMTRLVERPHILAQACEALIKKANLGNDPLRFIGSAMGSITIAHECARIQGGMMAYTEKDDQRMRFARFNPSADEKVILVEDVIKTGSTIYKTIRACKEAGVELKPIVLAIVNSSSLSSFDFSEVEYPTAQIVTVLELHGREYSPQACPMCKEGSIAKRPKANWAEFAAHNV